MRGTNIGVLGLPEEVPEEVPEEEEEVPEEEVVPEEELPHHDGPPSTRLAGCGSGEANTSPRRRAPL